jgi:hypothetical protein
MSRGHTRECTVERLTVDDANAGGALATTIRSEIRVSRADVAVERGESHAQELHGSTAPRDTDRLEGAGAGTADRKHRRGFMRIGGGFAATAANGCNVNELNWLSVAMPICTRQVA